MICIKCKIEKPTEDFRKRPNTDVKEADCISCQDKKIAKHRAMKAKEEKERKLSHRTILLIEIIEACDSRNGRRLRRCVDKAKAEIGGPYAREGRRGNVKT